MWILFWMACSQSLDIVDRTGQLDEEDRRWIEETISEFMAQTDRCWLRAHRVEVVADVSEGVSGRYTTKGINRIELPLSIVDQRSVNVLRHELCHALDATEGITRKNSVLFSDGPEVDAALASLLHDEESREAEGFAALCASGPMPASYYFMADRCGQTLPEVHRFLLDNLWVNTPDVNHDDFNIQGVPWGEPPDLRDDEYLQRIIPIASGELWITQQRLIGYLPDQLWYLELSESERPPLAVPLYDGGVLLWGANGALLLSGDGELRESDLLPPAQDVDALVSEGVWYSWNDAHATLLGDDGASLALPWPEDAKVLSEHQFTGPRPDGRFSVVLTTHTGQSVYIGNAESGTTVETDLSSPSFALGDPTQRAMISGSSLGVGPAFLFIEQGVETFDQNCWYNGVYSEILVRGKRSAFGRLSGRQRSYADEVEGGEERAATRQRSVAQQAPFGGLPAGVCSPLPQRKGARPAYETFPAGTSSPAGRYAKVS